MTTFVTLIFVLQYNPVPGNWRYPNMPAWLVESLVAGVSITATVAESSNKVIVPTATFAGCANETAKILPGPAKDSISVR